jgi:oligopeptide transport system substrate-binding protein
MPHFLHFLALHVAVPIREEILAENGGKWLITGPSTGPYSIEEFKPDQYLRLEPNVHHEEVKEKGAVSVILRVVQDESTGASLFERGILDILTRIPNYERPRFKQKGWVKTDPFLATFYLGFNLKKAPFEDVRIRRAVSAAIKREEVVKILDSGEKPSFSFIPDGVEGFDGGLSIPVNTLKMDKNVSIEAGYDTSSRNAMIMEKVQHDLLETLGMKLSLTPLDWKSYVRQLSTDPAPLWRFGIMAPIKDPLYFLQCFTTGDPSNYAGFSDLEYDTWVSQIRKLPLGAKRTELLKKAQKRLVVEQAVVVPLYHYTQSHAVSNRVTGFHVNPFGVIRFSDLSITEN